MSHRNALLGVFAVFCAAASPASAQLVTYSWTTTAEGFGSHVSQPTAASFQVPLSAVQSGQIMYSDITNIQLEYPGLTFDSFTPTSNGLDSLAFVDPTTGAFIFHDINQGLGVVGYQGGLFSSSFLSITIDNPYSPFGQPLTSVADQYNALNNGSPYAGFPTAGHWTAAFESVIPAVPEPATWGMMLLGLGLIGRAVRRRPLKAGFAWKSLMNRLHPSSQD